ncbi:MAG: hypothetical protein HC849_33115 [Oscillatoriales cyanobacterium RU_3_3]|nr:hypothetical protein [Oscillatoriales cyanobacterium RU_3_3]
MASALEFDNLTHAGQAAMVIGALIHQGYDPTPAIEPLIARLNYLLTMCWSDDICCGTRARQTAGTIDREEEDLFERTLCQLAPTRQIEMDAWQALGEFFTCRG